ncbi:MAG: dockerin type I domain-containing protein [Pirellulaceae bacterium]
MNRLGEHRVRYSFSGELGAAQTARVNIDGRWIWHNDGQHEDVNGDGDVTPLDALIGINLLSERGVLTTEALDAVFANNDQVDDLAYFDANNDGWVTPIDVLRVINHLNRAIQDVHHSSIRLDGTLITANQAIDFGNVKVGESRTMRLTIDGIRQAQLETSVIPSASGNVGFAATRAVQDELDDMIAFDVVFTPTNDGVIEESVLLINDLRFQLVGQGVA